MFNAINFALKEPSRSFNDVLKIHCGKETVFFDHIDKID